MYKATASSGWQGVGTALVGISVGREYHEGEKLKSYLRWTNKRFQRCIIRLCDTGLWRRINPDNPQQGYATGAAWGDTWFMRNLPIIQEVFDTMPIIVRWAELLAHPNYEQSLKAIQSLYQDSPTFRDALMSDAQNYVKRNNLPQKEVFKSMDYLMEEFAIDHLMAQKQPLAHIYPGSPLVSKQVMIEQVDLSYTCIKIGFKRRKEPLPLAA